MEGNFSNRVQDVIRLSREEAIRLGHDDIGTEHFLLSLLRDEDNIAAQILNQFSVTYDAVRAELDNIISGRPTSPPKSAAAEAKKPERTKTPVLDNFGRDLTKMAADDK